MYAEYVVSAQIDNVVAEEAQMEAERLMKK